MALSNAVNSSHGLQYLKTNGTFPTITDGNLNDTLLAQGSNVPPVWFDQNGVISVNIRKQNVDFTTTGDVLVYTPPVGYNFIPITVITYYTTIVNYINTGAYYSLGVNSPNYDNLYGQILTTFSSPPTTTTFRQYTISNSSNNTSFSTSVLPVYAKIESANVATTALGTIYLQGVLIPQ